MTKISFLENLQGTLPVGLCLFSKAYSSFVKASESVSRRSLPVKMSSLFTGHSNKFVDIVQLQSQAEEFLKVNSPTADQIEYLTESTTAQAQSVVWHEYRVDVITGSVAYDIMKTNLEEPGMSYIRKVCNINTNINTPQIKHGREQEHDVFTFFKKNVNSYGHIDGDVAKTGLKLLQSMPWIGATADGIVSCQCHGKTVLEIKCPYTYRHDYVHNMYGQPGLFLDENGKLRSTSRHYFQVQLQMYAYNTQYCDFIVKCQDYSHQLVQRDEIFCKTMVAHLDTFWKKHILPELITRRLQYGSDVESPSGTNKENVELYCYSKQ